jgi:hypothetical protein
MEGIVPRVTKWTRMGFLFTMQWIVPSAPMDGRDNSSKAHSCCVMATKGTYLSPYLQAGSCNGDEDRDEDDEDAAPPGATPAI